MRQEHWNTVFSRKAPDDVSWYQERPAPSLKLIQACGLGQEESVIDVGGGASVLVDFMLDAGFEQPAVLDISGAALEHARQRLCPRAGRVEWFEADVTEFNSPRHFALWHDGAVFHFLTEAADRRKYLDTLRRGARRLCHHRHLCRRWPSEVQRARPGPLQRAKYLRGAWPRVPLVGNRGRVAQDALGHGTTIQLFPVHVRTKGHTVKLAHLDHNSMRFGAYTAVEMRQHSPIGFALSRAPRLSTTRLGGEPTQLSTSLK